MLWVACTIWIVSWFAFANNMWRCEQVCASPLQPCFVLGSRLGNWQRICRFVSFFYVAQYEKKDFLFPWVLLWRDYGEGSHLVQSCDFEGIVAVCGVIGVWIARLMDTELGVFISFIIDVFSSTHNILKGPIDRARSLLFAGFATTLAVICFACTSRLSTKTLLAKNTSVSRVCNYLNLTCSWIRILRLCESVFAHSVWMRRKINLCVACCEVSLAFALGTIVVGLRSNGSGG